MDAQEKTGSVEETKDADIGPDLPLIWPISVVLGFMLVVSVLGYLFVRDPGATTLEPAPQQQAEKVQAQKPMVVTGVCLRINQPDLPHHTPAYVVEENGITNMPHTTRAGLRCRLYIDGKSVEADLNQIFVARFAKAPKSRH